MSRRELIFFAALTLSLPAAARQVSDQPGDFKFIARSATGALIIAPIDRLADFGGVKTNNVGAFKVALFKWRGGATRFNFSRSSSPRFNFRGGGRSFARFPSTGRYSTPLAHSRGLSAAPLAGHSSFSAAIPPTQFRSSSVTPNPAILQNHATKAETDLIGRLHTLQNSSPTVSQPTVSASIAQTQFKAPQPAVPVNPVVMQNQAAKAEESLLKNLQTPKVTPQPASIQIPPAQLPSTTPLQTAMSNYTFKVTPSGAVQVFKNGQFIGSGTPHQPTPAELALLNSQQKSGPTISQIIASASTPQAQIGTPKPNVPLNLSAIQARATAIETALLKALQAPTQPVQPVQPANRPFLGVGQNALDAAFSTKMPVSTAASIKASAPAITGAPSASAFRPSSADSFLRAVMNDPKRSLSDRQSAAQALSDTTTFREIAAIALGKDLGASGGGASAIGATKVAPAVGQILSSVSTIQPTVPNIQTTLPQQGKTSLAAVQLGSSVTGFNAVPASTVVKTTPQSSAPPSTPTSGYTYATTPDKTVQVFQNGKLISTTTPDNAKLNYGYQAPSTNSPPITPSTGSPSSGLAVKTTTTPAVTQVQVAKAEDVLLKNLQTPKATPQLNASSGLVKATPVTGGIVGSNSAGPLQTSYDSKLANAAGYTFKPMGQLDKANYSTATQEQQIGPEACKASIYASITQTVLEKQGSQSAAAAVKINNFYQEPSGANWWGTKNAPNTIANKVTFSDGKGTAASPSDSNAFSISKNNPNFASMLTKGPVMIRDSTVQSKSGVQEGHWMLATGVTDGGKSIVANDPLSGQQVKLDYSNGKIGRVTSILDPVKNQWVPVNNLSTAAKISLEKDISTPNKQFPDNDLSVVSKFIPDQYFAVTIK
jgi:hypothetical protein